MVNAKIEELLEQGTVPWRKPWNAESNWPKNLISKRPYHGVNVWLLGCQQYNSPWWLSFKQATQDKGGHIRKGEKSSLVVFLKWLDRTTGNETEQGEGDVHIKHQSQT
jgi:antirestriction protein ArdC